MTHLGANVYALEAERFAGRFDDGSTNVGTLAIVEVLLAVAEELRMIRSELREARLGVPYIEG